jgi:hypothetical protein
MQVDYVRLGNTGVKVESKSEIITCPMLTSTIQVSKICIGMMSYGSSAWQKWVLDREAAFPLIKKALDMVGSV